MIVIDVDAPTVDATHLACVQRVFPCLLPANTPLPHSVTASVHPTWQHVPLNGDGFDRIAERCIALLDGGRAGVVVDFSDSSLVLSLVAAAQQSSKNSYSDHVLYLAEQLIERFSLPPARLVFRLTDHVQAGIAQAFIDLGFSVWLPSIPEQLSCSSKLWLAASAKDKKDPSIVTIVPYSSIPLKNMPASLAALFISTLRTDRDDGLYTTVVVDEHQVCLGLVYSSLQSIETAIVEGAGVYYSRSRQQLWRKGETSGVLYFLLTLGLIFRCCTTVVANGC
jgi:phosphoribosyl-AMP cyclohydrolase